MFRHREAPRLAERYSLRAQSDHRSLVCQNPRSRTLREWLVLQQSLALIFQLSSWRDAHHRHQKCAKVSVQTKPTKPTENHQGVGKSQMIAYRGARCCVLPTANPAAISAAEYSVSSYLQYRSLHRCRYFRLQRTGSSDRPELVSVGANPTELYRARFSTAHRCPHIDGAF